MVKIGKKQQWDAIRVGRTIYEEIKATSKRCDRPMTSIIRMLWNKHKKEVKNGL